MRYLVSFLSISLILFGCDNSTVPSEETSAPKEAEASELTKKEKRKIILSYINDAMKVVTDFQDEALEEMQAADGDGTLADEKMYEVLVSTAIPAQEKAVEAVNEIEPEIEELKSPHSLIVKAMDTFLEALNLRKEALEKQDEDLLGQSDEKYVEYLEMVQAFHLEMGDLTSEYKITYTPRDMDLLTEALSTREEQIAIVGFINEGIGQATEFEEKALERMHAVSGENYKDDETMHDALVSDIIPDYELFVEKVKEIEPGIEELEPPHKLLVEAIEMHLEILELRVEALEKQSHDLMAKSEERYMEFLEMIAEYHAMLGEVASKYNVKYDPGA